MLAGILPSGVLGLVVAGMLAATMSVNSSYLLGWSSIIAQDIVVPLREKELTSRQQLTINRVANVFVSAFVMVWGLWYTLPGPTYFYLNMTASIYLSGTLVAVVAGLFWSRATTLGGYMAMGSGALATIAFFFFKTPASYAGLGAFLLAAIGMLIGSWMSKPEAVTPQLSASS
jgi:SSS family solute:Na+ symporter